MTKKRKARTFKPGTVEYHLFMAGRLIGKKSKRHLLAAVALMPVDVERKFWTAIAYGYSFPEVLEG